MTQVYFENIENYISLLLSGAKQRIYIAVAWFTNQELFDSIVKAAERNVNIKLLLLDDILNRNEFGLDFGILIEKGVVVRFANNKSGTMHHKFCIIDDKVITGSYNWTYHANKNDENILMTDEESVVNNYRMEFDRLFGSASPIAQPYEHLNWTDVKEGDFSEFRRDIYREVNDKEDIDMEWKKNKLISLNKAYKSGNNEELAKASLLATEQRRRTITDVLTSRSQDFTYRLWEENSAGKPLDDVDGYKYVGKWWYVPSCIKEDKYHREYIEGELRTNAGRDDEWFVKGLNLKIYDEQFISDIKNVLGSNTLSITNWKSIPDRMHRMLRIDLAKMFYYKFPTPMFNKKQQRSWKNSMPRKIPAINVFGIVKDINGDNVIFYEGWDPQKRGEKIAREFFEKEL